MSFLHNLFSSPGKHPPPKKRNLPDPDTDITRSGEKRKREAYDPEEYQNAVYAGAGTVAVSGDDGYEMDGDELDEEVAVACQLQDEAEFEAGVEIGEDDDGNDDARPYATPKSVRKLSRDLYNAVEARGTGSRASKTETHDKAGKTLASTSTRVAMSQSPSICTGSETENEEDEILDEIDWSSSDDDLRLSFSPTTSSAGLDVTSTGEIKVDRLKHTPVGKQPRPRAGAVRSNTTTTGPTPAKPSPSPLPTKPSITPLPQSPSSPSYRTMPSPLTTPTHPPNFAYPPEWHEKTPEERWDTNPNLRARELHASPRRIHAELPSEPLYAFRDAEIRDGLWSLMSSVEDFAKRWFKSGAHACHTTTATAAHENGDGHGVTIGHGDVFIKKEFFKTLTPETTKLINCVASGGPSGLWGWHDLFVNKEKMQALVCAMIGNLLSEQVLQHAFFGGTEEGVRAVAAVQREGKDWDGFERNARYAATIRQHLPTPTSLPYNFNTHVNTIIGALWTHLSPLLSLVHPPTYPASTPLPIPAPSLKTVFDDLRRLTVSAGILSLHMHLDPHTAYHHVPLFKEDNYDSSVMECWNDPSMRQRNMRNQYEDVGEKEQKRRDALSETEKKRARGDTALTQILCFNGVTAYRKGGWEVGSSTPSDPVYERREWRDMGVRVRVLTQGLVYCRWGRALSSQETADMDNETGKKIHGDAWRRGGFMQFTDVEGVFDWLGAERKEKVEARRAVLEKMAERANAGAAAEKTVLQAEGAKKKGKGRRKPRGEIGDADPDR
ncbi:hypothetical protein J4E85_008951 [Alternaria conjuncta]|uniref:uncharacterized protein n=1 Tax=Alternaria conjuncta TaxID=181017 RepID=UPI00221FC573|nr:uncharacterized protein J4E85_008951 [Alternaria conjuncta]KAI4920836.1 hypothetical protein J4E85_008951 [Alternaria conjuncta]